MAKKIEMIQIPMALARLLAATKDDMKDPDKYEDVQEIAKASLKVLMEIK